LWDFLGELAKDAADYELTTWAGFANVAGFFVLMKLAVPVEITEKAMDRFSTLLEGSRRYRAAKRGFQYEPVYREPRQKPEKGHRLKGFLMVCGYLLLSVAVIAVVDRVLEDV